MIERIEWEISWIDCQFSPLSKSLNSNFDEGSTKDMPFVDYPSVFCV